MKRVSSGSPTAPEAAQAPDEQPARGGAERGALVQVILVNAGAAQVQLVPVQEHRAATRLQFAHAEAEAVRGPPLPLRHGAHGELVEERVARLPKLGAPDRELGGHLALRERAERHGPGPDALARHAEHETDVALLFREV